jgi:hypothetical protein
MAEVERPALDIEVAAQATSGGRSGAARIHDFRTRRSGNRDFRTVPHGVSRAEKENWSVEQALTRSLEAVRGQGGSTAPS